MTVPTPAHTQAHEPRDYAPLIVAAAAALPALRSNPHLSHRRPAMQLIVDLLWDAFNHGTVTSGSPQRPRAISWVGFYAPDPADPQAMILAARRDKPACSPIGLHGACGQSHRERLALVIPDIATLGAGYIACDPRDRAELVVPLLQADGSSLGVLDFDSYDTNAFTHDDALGAIHLLRTVGLFTWPGDAASIIQQR